MVESLPATSGYWLLHAADARAAAERMSDAQSKLTMLFIARGYEKMAEHAARQELRRARDAPSEH